MSTNTFLTSKEIARKALPVLQEALAFPALATLDYSETFSKKGDTIQVTRPAVFVADEFGSTINLQDINPFPILVTMDKIADVSVEITAKQMALNLEDFQREVLQPAMVAIAEKINSDGLNLYKYVHRWVGTSGSTPDGLDDIANARAMLNKAKAPLGDRAAIWNPDADAKLSILDALANAEKSGSTAALREGAIGRVQGLDNYMAQSVKTHTAGGYTTLADVTGTVDIANNAVDTTTGLPYSVAALTSAAGAATSKLLKGDILTLNGLQYTVLADTASASSGVISSVKIFPKLTASITSRAVTFPDKTATAHVANLAFHKAAFGFVTRPLEPAMGCESSVVSFGGLSLRVVIDYDISTKKQTMSIDVLYGWAPLYPELACRVLG